MCALKFLIFIGPPGHWWVQCHCESQTFCLTVRVPEAIRLWLWIFLGFRISAAVGFGFGFGFGFVFLSETVGFGFGFAKNWPNGSFLDSGVAFAIA